MGVEDPVEVRLVGVCEMVGPPQQGETGFGTGQVRMLGDADRGRGAGVLFAPG